MNSAFHQAIQECVKDDLNTEIEKLITSDGKTKFKFKINVYLFQCELKLQKNNNKLHN